MTKIFLFLLVCSINLLSQPKIEIVGGNSFNWGNVKPIDSPLRTRVELKNTGNQPLRIFSVEPGCGCTTAPLNKDLLNPGESAFLDVKLELRSEMGPLEKKIKIMTNDPENKNIEYLLLANVIVALTKEPSFFAFSTLKIGEKATASIRIKNHLDYRITFKKIISNDENLKLSLKPEDFIEPNAELEITAEITPQKSGPYTANITFMTNSVDLPRMNVGAFGKVD